MKVNDMFDDEELEILQALENGSLKRSVNVEEEIALAQKSAKEYLRKSENITLRLSMMDLKGIKEKSKELDIPYQTIVSSLVHQYVNGKVKLA
jgi:predicted DNA binding CopG/RHH family protein